MVTSGSAWDSAWTHSALLWTICLDNDIETDNYEGLSLLYASLRKCGAITARFEPTEASLSTFYQLRDKTSPD